MNDCHVTENSIAVKIPAVKGNLQQCWNWSTNCLGDGLPEDYGYRIRYAKRRWEDRNDPQELSWRRLALLCLEVLQRDNPERRLDPTAVLNWKDGKQEPRTPEYKALAEVLGATYVWLRDAEGEPPTWVPWTPPQEPGQAPPNELQGGA